MPRARTDDALRSYRAKRDFERTPEPGADAPAGAGVDGALEFVVQKHWATRLHYDFRLELEGRMLSWAVPKGPSYDPKDKRMAVHVEDHPMAYNRFEGEIPARQYGAGKVMIWDKGLWVPVGDPARGLREGHLKFDLHGHKLHGRWALVRIKGREGERGGSRETWLLVKDRDDFARPALEFSVVDEFPDSVAALPMPQAPSSASSAALAAGAASTAAPSEPAPAPAKPRSRAAALRAVPQGARRADLPARLSPQLATLADRAPGDMADWVWEIKFDGYRILARIDADGVRLFTRNGHDWTDRLPRLAQALARRKLAPCWLDGEIVVLGDAGGTDFQALQNAFDREATQAVVYFVFDLPFHAGLDLRAVPLAARRERLQAVLGTRAEDAVRFSQGFEAPAGDMLESARRAGLEGVIGKRRDSPYVSRRSPDWIKLKCVRRQEFVVGGYTDPQGARNGLGALLLGVHDERGALVFVGGVGSGFTEGTLAHTHEALQALRSDTRPFARPTGMDRRAHWVRPTLVAEVSFSEWTGDGHLRHPVFRGLRDDKPARAIVREQPVAPKRGGAAPPAAKPPALPEGLRVSNPDRVIDPDSGATKIEVVRHYGLVAPLMMPFLRGRPVSLVRAPQGVGGELFFQKHLEHGQMPGVRMLDPALWPAHEPLIEIAQPRGLQSAAQMNTVELHTWNALKSRIDRPDQLVFDLDPGEGVPWASVPQAALLLKALLEALGLVPFCKTSGGKGLHVLVPIKRLNDWDTAKGFSQAVVRHMAQTLPQLIVAKSGPRNRVGRIFVDYLRNGFGATTACAWSLRARPGIGVSVPVAWEEVPTLRGGDQWRLRDIHARLDVGNTPWEGLDQAARALGPAMKRLGFAPASAGVK